MSVDHVQTPPRCAATRDLTSAEREVSGAVVRSYGPDRAAGLATAHQPGADRPGPARDSVVAAPGGIRVRITRAGPGAIVVSLAGEVDLATAHVAATALTGAIAAGPGGRVVLDLDQVGFMAVHGLSVILAAHTDARHHGAVLVLALDGAAPAATTPRFLPSTGPVTYSTRAEAIVGLDRP